MSVVNQWITTVVIVFGIVVAIICVIAYLRMYKDSAWSATHIEQNEPPAEEPFSLREQITGSLIKEKKDIK